MMRMERIGGVSRTVPEVGVLGESEDLCMASGFALRVSYVVRVSKACGDAGQLRDI